MIKKILVAFLMLFTLIGVTGCGGFVMEETLEIESIDYKLMEDGRTQIKISYTDETIEPSIFYLPQGKPGVNGENGNGIKEVSHKQSEDGKTTNIHIEFTQKGFLPVDVVVPNGISVTSVTTEVNEGNGDTILTVNFSDGSKSDPIIIPKGEKGDAGVGLSNFEIITNKDGSKTLIFKYSDGSDYRCDIPAPEKGDPGKDGNYITAIGSDEDDEFYYITFIFNEGEPKLTKFKKPEKPNTWLNGNDLPQASAGKDGDYYFDTLHKTIYTKTLGSWVIVVDLDDNNESYVVSFDLNDKDGVNVDATLPNEAKSHYLVVRGSNFFSSRYTVPMPQRQGFSFAGWYTTKTPNINNGAFTDLTPVFADLTLYAKWVEDKA